MRPLGTEKRNMIGGLKNADTGATLPTWKAKNDNNIRVHPVREYRRRKIGRKHGERARKQLEIVRKNI